MIAVGVARPSAHGQAMISTATAAVNASSAGCPVSSHAASVAERDHDHDRDEDRRDPVGEPLHRRLRALRLGHEPRDLGERGLAARRGSPPPRAGRTRSRSRRTRRRPSVTSTGTDSPVSIDTSTADDPVHHDAVGRDLLARAHHEPLSDPQLVDRDLLARLEPARCGRRARAAPAARRTSAAWRASRSTCRAAAARSPRPRSRSRRARRSRCRCPPSRTCPTAAGVEEHERDHRPQPGRDGPDGHERVHRDGAVAQVRPGGAVVRPPAPEHDRRRERARDPLPAVEHQRRHHRDEDDRARRARPRRRGGAGCRAGPRRGACGRARRHPSRARPARDAE